MASSKMNTDLNELDINTYAYWIKNNSWPQLVLSKFCHTGEQNKSHPIHLYSSEFYVIKYDYLYAMRSLTDMPQLTYSNASIW